MTANNLQPEIGFRAKTIPWQNDKINLL